MSCADDRRARRRADGRPRRRRRCSSLVGVVVVLVLDVVSKVLVVAQLRPGTQPVRILGGAIYLDEARNSGAAFSLGTGFTVDPDR